MSAFFIMFLIFSLLIAGSFYLLTGKIISGFLKNAKTPPVRIIRLVASVVFAALCLAFRTMMIVGLYLFIIYALFGLVAFIVRRLFKSVNKKALYKAISKIYRIGIAQLLTLAIIMGYGFYTMNNLVATHYTVESAKIKNSYKIVLLTDLHYDTIQNKQVIKSKIAEINALEPDLVLLGGDIVEEGTSNTSMKEVFSVLGGLVSKYGTYYVYGNHDRQTYTQNSAYTLDELNMTMALHSIFPLKDKAISVNNELYLIGREDASVKFRGEGRADITTLLSGANENQFILLLDHQPVEFENNAKNGVDLQLSGHTHGGQIFPIGRVGELLGVMNSYGEYRVNNFTAIVSSGVAGWGFMVRTERASEYVVIDLVPEG